jgi:hypothetical protein
VWRDTIRGGGADSLHGHQVQGDDHRNGQAEDKDIHHALLSGRLHAALLLASRIRVNKR